MTDYFFNMFLIKFAKWCNAVGLFFNTDKCKVMTFHRFKEFIRFDYSLTDGFPLLCVTEIMDLGFLPLCFLTGFSSSYKFHCLQFYYCKALRVLGVIQRHSSKCFSVLYSSLVRTLLEYGAVIWSPLP